VREVWHGPRVRWACQACGAGGGWRAGIAR